MYMQAGLGKQLMECTGCLVFVTHRLLSQAFRLFVVSQYTAFLCEVGWWGKYTYHNCIQVWEARKKVKNSTISSITSLLG